MAMEITSKYSVPEVTVYNETSLAQHGTDQSKSCLCPETSLDVEEIKKISLAQHGTDQSKSCLCTESFLDVEEIKKTSFAQHETDQSKSCLCPESSLDVDEIKKKLMDYNIDLQTHMMPYYDTFISREHMIKITKEVEELIPCLLRPGILPNLQSFLKSDAHSYILIDCEKIFYNTRHYDILEFYFDLYCDNTEPEVFFNSIHEVWKYQPDIEFTLRLLCCKRLLKNKHYDILNRLIQNNEEYFSIEHINFGSYQRFAQIAVERFAQIAAIDLWDGYADYLTVLLILLCNYVTSRQTEKIKAVLLIVSRLSSYSGTYVSEGSEYFMLFTLSLKQTRLIPSLIKVLLNRPELHYLSSSIVSLCNERLLEVDCHNTYNKSMDCIKANSHFILNLPFLLEERECHVRQTHCKLLLTLLHAYVMCDDLTNMDHVLNRLLEFRQSLLQSENIACACFLGKQSCNHRDTNSTSDFLNMINMLNAGQKIKNKIKNKSRFKFSILELTINDTRNKVIKEKLGPVWYLKPMIDAVEKYLESGEEGDLREEFSIFIKRISLHNETGLYDIVKTLCDLEMKPEIQDIFIQGLTDYIHVKCNKQNSIYSRLLLDINMTCCKGEFLQKLTINVGQLFDEDIGNDVEKIIYRCFCILRQENKETDIANYQVYFTFISTMDAEDKMLKMSNLRSSLLMLILLMISSGSQHKSAKLKKYLSLKYAYEDAILYLLWCSGDVEINPGPTLKKLRPQADSVKKRNWIHEMCTTALKLLKNKAVDSKTDGLWKEKPDNWQELHGVEPFYDPRNKPKGKQYSIKNDEELLNSLFICCDRMSIKLPCNLQSEISSWKSEKRDIALLLELYVSRQEIVAMKMAKDLLIKYADTPEYKKYMKDCNVDLSFNPKSTQKDSPKRYLGVVRDLAITFCRVSKGLPIFEKSDGMWKTPPQDWNPNNLYYSPCNTEKRHKKHQDQQLIDDLLSYCEKKSKSIPSELQLVVDAWKLKNECKLEKSRKICKHYTIWSSMAIIQHSLKYLEIEGLLEKPDVQQSLKQIGVSLHCEKSSNQHNNDSTVTTDNKSKVSGLPTNSLSNNQKGTNSSSSLSDSDIVCSQHPYEAKALTNSHSTKSVKKCSKPDFQNHPSTSNCTIYSTLVPCPDSRGDLQYTDERLDIPDSYKSVSEISCQEPDFQPSTSSCTFDSKKAPCQEESVDLQPRDDRDLSDSHKSLPEISCEEPDLQPITSGCSTFNKRPECRNVRDKVPSTGRIQKRSRPSSEERSEKRPRLHSENESQESITRCNGDTTPSSHCDSDIADQCVNSIGNMEDSSDQSSNRIPPDNIQDTDSSKDQLFGPEDEIPQHLDEIADRYIIVSFDNQEENWEENLEENLGEDLENIDKLLKLWET